MSKKYGIRKISKNAMKSYENKNGVILTRISERVGDHYLSDSLEDFGNGVTKRVVNNRFTGGYTMKTINTYGKGVEDHTLYERRGERLKVSTVEYFGNGVTKCFEWEEVVDDGRYVSGKNYDGIKRNDKRKRISGKVIDSKKVEKKKKSFGVVFGFWFFVVVMVLTFLGESSNASF